MQYSIFAASALLTTVVAFPEPLASVERREAFDDCAVFGDLCKDGVTRFCDPSRGKVSTCYHVGWGSNKCWIETEDDDEPCDASTTVTKREAEPQWWRDFVRDKIDWWEDVVYDKAKRSAEPEPQWWRDFVRDKIDWWEDVVYDKRSVPGEMNILPFPRPYKGKKPIAQRSAEPQWYVDFVNHKIDWWNNKVNDKRSAEPQWYVDFVNHKIDWWNNKVNDKRSAEPQWYVDFVNHKIDWWNNKVNDKRSAEPQWYVDFVNHKIDWWNNQVNDKTKRSAEPQWYVDFVNHKIDWWNNKVNSKRDLVTEQDVQELDAWLDEQLEYVDDKVEWLEDLISKRSAGPVAKREAAPEPKPQWYVDFVNHKIDWWNNQVNDKTKRDVVTEQDVAELDNWLDEQIEYVDNKVEWLENLISKRDAAAEPQWYVDFVNHKIDWWNNKVNDKRDAEPQWYVDFVNHKIDWWNNKVNDKTKRDVTIEDVEELDNWLDEQLEYVDDKVDWLEDLITKRDAAAEPQWYVDFVNHKIDWWNNKVNDKRSAEPVLPLVGGLVKGVANIADDAATIAAKEAINAANARLKMEKAGKDNALGIIKRGVVTEQMVEEWDEFLDDKLQYVDNKVQFLEDVVLS